MPSARSRVRRRSWRCLSRWGLAAAGRRFGQHLRQRPGAAVVGLAGHHWPRGGGHGGWPTVLRRTDRRLRRLRSVPGRRAATMPRDGRARVARGVLRRRPRRPRAGAGRVPGAAARRPAGGRRLPGGAARGVVARAAEGARDTGEQVLVVGGGSVGLLAVAAARAMGLEVDLEARHPHQNSAGERLGAGSADGEYDIAVEAAGTDSGAG